MNFETVRIHFLSDVFGLLSSTNFTTMATWRNDFLYCCLFTTASVLLPACRRLLFPLLHATKEIGDVCTQARRRLPSPQFFFWGKWGGGRGWGASVHRQKSNHYRIDQSASGSYSNTLLRKDLIPGPSLQKLLCSFCSLIWTLWCNVTLVLMKSFTKKWCLDLLKSAKLRWFKVQKFRKNQTCAP